MSCPTTWSEIYGKFFWQRKGLDLSKPTTCFLRCGNFWWPEDFSNLLVAVLGGLWNFDERSLFARTHRLFFISLGAKIVEHIFYSGLGQNLSPIIVHPQPSLCEQSPILSQDQFANYRSASDMLVLHYLCAQMLFSSAFCTSDLAKTRQSMPSGTRPNSHEPDYHMQRTIFLVGNWLL